MTLTDSDAPERVAAKADVKIFPTCSDSLGDELAVAGLQ